MRIRRRGNRGSRTPVFGIAVLTPIVLAGAVAAAPGVAEVPLVAGDPVPLAAADQEQSDGVAVVAMAKPPSDFRFAANTLGLPPPAAVISSAGGMRIPAMALSAYRKAEQTMAASAPDCGVSWNLLAGIGRIESSHANGGATDTRGTSVRPIYGPVLDGSLPGNEIIVQSNTGGQTVYARAMGPMQFLPGTWSRYASDGDGDGKADPQNLFDASLSAARYLCSGGMNLRNQAQVLTAVLRYNNSMAYAQNVLGWAAAYATGVAPIDLPPISGPIPALGSLHMENPEGLELDTSDLHTADLMAQLMGNSTAAAQMMPGPASGPADSVLPEHGCQVICMASQLAPSEVATPENLPPWMQPMPWMAPPAPAPWLAPQAPLPGMAPVGTGPLPGAGPVGTGPLPGAGPVGTGPLPGTAPIGTGPLPGAAPAPAEAALPGQAPPPGAPAAPLPGMPAAPAEAPLMPPPGTPPWMLPPPPPGPAPADGPELPPAPGPLPGPIS
ncbi:MAG: lytic murein transglycosylase [Actinomycetia bacterium]|nr:lytic murein transglycosylase [Actinomycetes bacterium]